ncbi:YdcF family protein [Arachnia propionica]|uniref:YdcF family protein n=1 Tax=Arachnia propionica TaxID=1750 RepID=A0A3P1TEM4_9ACTN|nr:YdcF family protein [Arachnia propionica]RRD07366.1 YdcF family protein [Arachnia propionica]
MTGTTLIGLLLLGALFLVGWATWRRIRQEPRRIANAGWVLATVLLAIQAMAMLGFSTPLAGLLFLLVLSPLMAIGLAGFLILNGLIMLRKERFSLANSLSLLAGVGLVVAMVFCVGVVIIGDRRAFPAVALTMLATGWVALMFFCFVGYSWLYQRIVRRVQPDFIMVLGAGVRSGKVTPLLAGRIDRALGVWRSEVEAGRRPLLLMSGGQGPDEPVSEASAMAAYAVEQGVPESALVLEDHSTTTRENFQMSTDLVRAEPRLGPGATGLAVTSNYHAMRAALLARDLGTSIQVLGARTAWYYWPSAMLREFVAVVRNSPKAYGLGLALVTVPLTLLVALAAWVS